MTRAREPGGFAGALIIFGVGGFALVAQTLLFRTFLSVYEGNELGIASFFCSWLLWAAVGATIARVPVSAFLTRHFEFLPLLYIPAFLLQAWLIRDSRALAGIDSYELFPFLRMLPVSLLVNAPVGLLSGLLFALGCGWFSRTRSIAVARVYIIEAAGSFAGGVAVTLLLATGVAAETIFLYSAVLIATATGLFRLSQKAYASALCLVLVSGGALLTGVDQTWTRANNLQTWKRLLPENTYAGSFTTPQAKYLYGEYEGQFNVIAWETIVDSIPNAEHASEVIAINLAQQPNARRFMVIGPGAFSTCKRLLSLPQAELVTWLDPDPDYPRRLLATLPSEHAGLAERIDIPGRDIRRHLRETDAIYDLVILNLPNATTLALNRYFTREFFVLLKKRLDPFGVVGVRVSGGENFMGDELVNVGAATYHTLGAVFGGIVVKPGDESWLMASDGEQLRSEPAVLRDRFGDIPGAASLFPPAGLMSLYPPDRMSHQLRKYRSAIEADTQGLLLNTDRHPKALLHSLLFAARQSDSDAAGGASASFVRVFAAHGVPLLFMTIVWYGLLRLVYVRRGQPAEGHDAGVRKTRAFDVYTLVLLTGAVGMSASILLMFLFQSVYGSLFLYVGLVTALFMLGLCLGSLGCERLLLRRTARVEGILFSAIVVECALFFALYVLPGSPARPVFIALFFLAGLVSGVYVPVAATRLKEAGLADAHAGSRIGWSDNLGGAAGGLLTGLVLLPVFGSAATLALLAALLLVNLLPVLFRRFAPASPESGDRFNAVVRPVGYTVFGLCGMLLAASVTLHRAQAEDHEQRLISAARAMAPDAKWARAAHTLSTGSTAPYLVLRDETDVATAFVFATHPFAPGVTGYGGPINLATLVNTNGTLLGLRVIDSNETPAYLQSLGSWMQQLVDSQLFQPSPLAGVDGVSGATMTSEAILDTLRQSGLVFGREVLGLSLEGGPALAKRRGPDRRFVAFAVLAMFAVWLRSNPTRPVRRVFLLVTLVTCGFWLNIQYSLAQVFSLLSLNIPAPGLTGAFALVVLLPLLVLLLGNVYCGYLCPFGALQELIGLLRPKRFKTRPDKALWRYARTLKYALLFLFITLFALTLDPGLASADPLVTVFSAERGPVVAALAAGLLVLSFFYDRFWCRNLCPAGAFLSLLNGVKGLRRYIPISNYKVCMYGVTGARDLDCICCDRCRRLQPDEMKSIKATLSAPASWRRGLLFLTAAGVIAAFFARETISTWQTQRHAAASRSQGAGGASRARNVNMGKLLRLIEQGKLSDREALYYKPAGEEDSVIVP